MRKYIPFKKHIGTSDNFPSNPHANLIQFATHSQTWTTPTDWKPITKAFDDAIRDHCDSCKELSLVCLGLFGSAERMLRAWASERNTALLEAPSTEQLLKGEHCFPLQLGKKVVIPILEKCFLRHHQGLRWVEQLMETAWERQNELIIGCDLWAWKYLQHALQVDLLCSTPLINSEEPENGITSVIPNAIQNLALNRVRYSDSVALESRTNLYLLHTILIHCHLSTKEALELLPFVRHETQKAIVELNNQGFLHANNNRLEIAPTRYFEVYKQLRDRGFWVADIQDPERKK